MKKNYNGYYNCLLTFLILVCSGIGLAAPFPAHAQAFPFSLTVPAHGPEAGAWFSPFSLNAPSHLPQLSGWHAIFWAREDLQADARVQNISSETLWFANELPLFKAACFASVSALHDADGYFGGLWGLGCGWEASAEWSFGIRFLERRTPARPEQDGARDWAVSARFSPREDLSFTYQAESLLMHPVGGLPQERLHRLEFSWGRLNRLFAGAHLSERRLDFSLSGGFGFWPYRGIQLALSASWTRRHDEAVMAGPTPTRIETPDDFTVSASLSFQMDNLAVSQGFSLPGPTLDAFVRISSEKQKPSLFPEDDYVLLFDFTETPNEVRHARFALAVRACLRASACRGVLLKLGEDAPSWVQAEDWAVWIRQLRAAGKRSFVYGASFGEAAYALSAGADGIYVFPGGGIRLRGVFSHRFFLLDALERLGVGADFVTVGTYKSTPETFMRRSPTGPANAQAKSLLASRAARFDALVLQRPGLMPVRLDGYRSKMEIDAASALAEGLVDGQLYADQVPAAIFRKLGTVAGIRNATSLVPPVPRGQDFIALLVFDGEIVTSRPSLPNPLTGTGSIELQKAAAAILAAAQNPRVRAIVLRISSPGGSASASEALGRVVEQVARRKPVVVSVGDMAASGGYYMAAGARRIFASESSWIGSIGVFGGKFQAQALLQKMGVNIDTLRLSPMADADTPFRPYSDEERAALQKSLEYTYRRFVEAVARGRRFTLPAALRRADGRVMPGRTAQQEGLVDDIGALTDAIAAAAREAGLPSNAAHVALVYPPPEPVWKNWVKRAISEMNAPAPGFSVFSSLFLPGPWALWLGMPAPSSGPF